MKVSLSPMNPLLKTGTKHPNMIKRGTAIATSIFAINQDIAAHAAPFAHLHTSSGKVVWIAAGLGLFAGLSALGMLLYNRVKNKQPQVDSVKN